MYFYCVSKEVESSNIPLIYKMEIVTPLVSTDDDIQEIPCKLTAEKIGKNRLLLLLRMVSNNIVHFYYSIVDKQNYKSVFRVYTRNRRAGNEYLEDDFESVMDVLPLGHAPFLPDDYFFEKNKDNLSRFWKTT